MIKHSRAERDINAHYTNIENLVPGGSSLGQGIWAWEDWCRRAQDGAYGAGAAALRLVLAGEVIDRDAVAEADLALAPYLEGRRRHITLPILGKHGSGRSMTLMLLAHRLHERGVQDIFVVDDYTGFAATDLTHVLASTRRPLLVIDDADLQEAVRPISNVLGSRDLGVVATLSHPHTAFTFGRLGTQHPVTPIQLPVRPTAKELPALKHATGSSYVSARRWREIRRCNIRSARRMLLGDPPPEELARQLNELRAGDGPLAHAVQVLTASGSRDVLLPSALLDRVTGRRGIDDLEAWLQRRPIFDAADEAHAVWLEDREVLRLADEIWRREYVLDQDSVDDDLLDTMSAVLTAIKPERPADRKVARQLLRRLPGRITEEVMKSCEQEVSDCVSLESDYGTLVAWTSALPGLDVQQSRNITQALRDRIATVAPDTGALVELIVNEAERRRHSTDETVGALTAELTTLQQWATILELAEGKNGLFDREGLRTIAAYLRARPDSHGILRTRNSAQILTRQILRDGAPHDRIWMQDGLLTTVKDTPLHLQHLLAITRRCVMQRRFRLSLDPRWQPALVDQNVASDLQDEYERLYDERHAERVDDVVSLARDVLDSPLNSGMRDHQWEYFLSFVRYHQPELLAEVVQNAFVAQRDRWASAGLRSAHGTLLKLLDIDKAHRLLGSRGLVQIIEAANTHGLDGIDPKFLVYSIVETAAASRDPQLAQPALAALRGELEADGATRTRLVTDAWNSLLDALGLERTTLLHTVVPSLHASSALSPTAAVALLGSARALRDNPEPFDGDRLFEAFSGETWLRPRIFETCMTLHRDDLAREVVPPERQLTPNWRLRKARLEAIAGSLTKARESYGGARPQPGEWLYANSIEVSKTQAALGFRASELGIDVESRVWHTLSALNRPALLASRIPYEHADGSADRTASTNTR